MIRLSQASGILPSGIPLYRMVRMMVTILSLFRSAIRVTIPIDQMTEWVERDGVGVEARSKTGMQLLVEKDLQCLHRSVEQEPDGYPHPLMS